MQVCVRGMHDSNQLTGTKTLSKVQQLTVLNSRCQLHCDCTPFFSGDYKVHRPVEHALKIDIVVMCIL